MHELTFFPIGNADSFLIETSTGKRILFDYAHWRAGEKESDRRIDLGAAIRGALGEKRSLNIVAFTHADQDHVSGAKDFFFLEHDAALQSDERVRFDKLWVPAKFVLETTADLCEDAQVIRKEARWRLCQGQGIRVFSQPTLLRRWLDRSGITVTDDLVSDAGTVVPDFDLATDGIEFFVHSPFAEWMGSDLMERNENALVVQATFESAGILTRAIFPADVAYEKLAAIVKATKFHKNDQRLAWDLIKVPHHSSWKSLASEQGAEETTPDPDVAWLYEQHGVNAKLISTSDPIPTTDSVQPPHRQAAAYYRRVARRSGGEYRVTMEHPTQISPEPLQIEIDHRGATLIKRDPRPSTAALLHPAPRVG